MCVFILVSVHRGGANRGNLLRLWGLTDFVPKVFASFSLALHTNLLRLRRTDLMAMTRKSGSKCNPKPLKDMNVCVCVCVRVRACVTTLSETWVNESTAVKGQEGDGYSDT